MTHIDDAPIRLRLQFEIGGLPGEIEIGANKTAVVIEGLPRILGLLSEAGATAPGVARPRWDESPEAQPPPGSFSRDNPPRCPTHGSTMRISQRGDKWYCPKRILEDDGRGTPVYCKYTLDIK